jgi:cysteine desulfurase/selenocysteine lyase
LIPTSLVDVGAEFPLTKRMAYLDVAYHCVLPESVTRAMDSFCRTQLQGGGIPRHWDKGVEDARAKAARLIGADASEIAFVKSTADGLNVAATSLPLRKGDKVLLNDMEHASNVFPWLNLQRAGVEVQTVPTKNGIVSLDDLVAAIDSRTRVVAISAAQFKSGHRADLARLAGVCRPKGIYTVVDGIQGLGTLNMDVHALGIDMLACGAQKGLLGPYGIGVLYVRKELMSALQPGYLAGEGVVGGGKVLEMRLVEDARRFEIGNYNHPGIVGFSAGLDLLLKVGMKTIERHVLDLGQQLIEGLKSQGIPVFGPLNEPERSAIVSFEVPDLERAIERFEANGVRVASRRGYARVSAHLYNSDADITRVLDVLREHLAGR